MGNSAHGEAYSLGAPSPPQQSNDPSPRTMQACQSPAARVHEEAGGGSSGGSPASAGAASAGAAPSWGRSCAPASPDLRPLSGDSASPGLGDPPSLAATPPASRSLEPL